MAMRELARVLKSVPTTDGAGVKIRRSVGAGPMQRHDPFLMLDEFFSDDPDDYLAGFPAHPHRGFETVTYMLDGHMRHEDHLGNRGDLAPGDVQWMTAGRGIIHSEMPQQTEGRMRGFQLWINLPAREKMKQARYRDLPAAEIPSLDLGGGNRARVIAGALEHAGGRIEGPIAGLSTDPCYFDVVLVPNGEFEARVPSEHNAFLYVYEGSLLIGRRRDVVTSANAALLTAGDSVGVAAGPDGTSFLLLAAKPLGEPVAQYGPFVMNTRAELEQAFADYREGTLAQK